MIINLENIKNKQIKLDEIIEGNFEINSNLIFNHKVVALIVEVGEFANDSKVFKYWTKNKQPKNSLVEEYIDILHFLVSIGLNLENDKWKYEISEFNKKDSNFKTNLLLSFFTKIINSTWSKKDYYELMQSFLELGYYFEIDLNKLEYFYKLKHDKNIERVKNNY